MSLFELLEKVSGELPGCESMSIVSLESGLPLASVSAEHVEEGQAADAFHADLYRQTASAMAELGSEQGINHIVLEGDDAIFVSLPLEDSGYFWHVITGTGTTLGFTQAVLRKYQDQVVDAMRDLLEH